MESSWIVLALASAFLLATADAWTKRYFVAASASSLLMVRLGLSSLLLLPFALSEPWPNPPIEFWYWITPALILEVAATVIYIRALQRGRLSHSLPFMAFTPALVVLTGWVLLDEQVNSRGLFGIALTVIGAWFLFLAPGDASNPRRWFAPFRAIAKEPSARAMLGVASIFAVTAALGRGALQYAPAAWVGQTYFMGAAIVSLFFIPFIKGDVIKPILEKPWPAFIVALCMAGMVSFHFLALEQVETAYMITVKRTSLLFAMLYGAWWFREPGLKQNLFAGLVMLAGVGLVAWP